MSQTRLFGVSKSDGGFVFVTNPDFVVSPDCLWADRLKYQEDLGSVHDV